MERSLIRLKRWLEGKGRVNIEEFWLMKQDIASLSRHEPDLRGTSLQLWLYGSEFLRYVCYDDEQDPPQRELLEKTCSLIQQLLAANWNLKLTESGNLYAPDVMFPYAQEQEMARLEVLEVDNLEEASLSSDEGLNLAYSSDGLESLDSKSNSDEDFSSLDSNISNFEDF
ncbi:hypothetical protein MATL_G00047080 [Megalops atlanticus]|uniref:Uncharacterized protein n=1 Tax=Megalops atlanticus TaxID=7932 RepID=A0A9D3TIP4_MEGAT|nr:hypothetical protein MATL_G00047080 [Megalops atlanticus]